MPAVECPASHTRLGLILIPSGTGSFLMRRTAGRRGLSTRPAPSGRCAVSGVQRPSYCWDSSVGVLLAAAVRTRLCPLCSMTLVQLAVADDCTISQLVSHAEP